MMDGQGHRLTVAVVLLRGLRPWRPRAAFLPETLVLLADPVQLTLELFDAAALSLQKLGLVLNDVVELQEVLHRPVRALRAGLHGHTQSLRVGTTTGHKQLGPAGPQIHPPTSPDEWGGGGLE